MAARGQRRSCVVTAGRSLPASTAGTAMSEGITSMYSIDPCQQYMDNLSNLHAEMWACSDRIEKLAENVEGRIEIAPAAPDSVALAYRVAVDEIRAVLRGT